MSSWFCGAESKVFPDELTAGRFKHLMKHFKMQKLKIKLIQVHLN